MSAPFYPFLRPISWTDEQVEEFFQVAKANQEFFEESILRHFEECQAFDFCVMDRRKTDILERMRQIVQNYDRYVERVDQSN